MTFTRTATTISGFGSSARHQSGTLAIEKRCLELPGVYAEYYPWDADPEGIAWHLHRQFPGLDHYFWGHSFGGHTVAKVCQHLYDLGEPLAGVCLVDPVVKVFRHWLLSPLSTAMWWAKIKLPPISVSRVTVFNQRMNKPDGDTVLVGRQVVKPVTLDVQHDDIDESPEAAQAFLSMLGPNE